MTKLIGKYSIFACTKGAALKEKDEVVTCLCTGWTGQHRKRHD